MEYLDEVNERGEPTGRTVEREFAHSNGTRHRTAHVWIIRQCDGKMQVLLQKRSKTKDSYPGCYDISSAGHIPAGSDYKESAIRELKEELGITAAPDDLIYCGQRKFLVNTSFNGKKFIDNQVSNVYALVLDYDESAFTPDNVEVESVRWFDFDECFYNVRNNLFSHCIFEEELLMLKDKATHIF
ncbi:MAG: NUDIX domain-containing protein [Acutalibacteraceae bacterium]